MNTRCAHQLSECRCSRPLIAYLWQGLGMAGLLLSPRLQCVISATDDLGRCSLHHSSQAGAVSTTELLVRAGVDHSSRASTSQLTPLHYAAKVWAGIDPVGLCIPTLCSEVLNQDA